MLRREFELAGGGSFAVEWSAPQPDDLGDFRCEYSFKMGDYERSSHAFGVNSVQALTLALAMAHVDLLATPEGRRSEIKWLGMDDLGLPLPGSVTRSDFRAPRDPSTRE